jgi:tetratricopeptide (TPR) repeat protein
MKKYLFLLTLIGFYACNQDTETSELSIYDKDVLKIDSIEKQIRISIDSAKNPSIELALSAVKAYEVFVYKYPEDSLAPGYLFKTAQISEAMLGDKAKAVNVYQKIYDGYPDYSNRPMMLFYQANSLHDLGDTANAVNQLKLFIARYPDHEFRDDAENLIDFIQMDEEELQKFFK